MRGRPSPLNRNVPISHAELERFLGFPLSTYNQCDIGERTLEAAGQHDRILHLLTLFKEGMLVYGLAPKIKALQPSRSGMITGDVWRMGYGSYTIYWAPIPERGHSIIVLGGDTYNGGTFDVLENNGNDDFHELLFSPTQLISVH